MRMRYINYVLFLVVGLVLGCTMRYAPIQYPVPQLPAKPKIIFLKGHDEHLGMDLICMTEDHMRDTFEYIVDLQAEVEKAKATIDEINKGNK